VDAQVCSRFFAPWADIDEDPATGSAHAVLAHMYSAGADVTPILFRAQQRSQRRGTLDVAVARHGAPVVVTGGAVTVLRGTLLMPDTDL
jgi:predicted PhzF superfamily epimerase YddE/YHI9